VQNTRNKHISSKISPYLPSHSVELVSLWLSSTNVHLKVTRQRSSKLGDYRPVNRGEQHLISVNGSLNKYAFFLTLVHEIAHMNNFIVHCNKVKPHGQAWKNEFKKLMAQFDLPSVFPAALLPAIENYMHNPKASSSSDTSLSLALRAYDEQNNASVVISEIQMNAHFTTHNGRVFIKGPKQRKRYKCKELATQRLYLFNPITEVMPA